MSNTLFNQPLATQEPLYSYHAFLFPFEWTDAQDSSTRLLEDQTDLSLVESIMGQAAGQWSRGETWIKPSSLAQYNELVYFYDFVRPVLYDSNEPKSLQRHYYFQKKNKTLEYLIEISGRAEPYRLEIDDIVVSYFNTGVGVLAFHLLNKKIDQSSPQDILNINALGRRIYPPFFKTDNELIGSQTFFTDSNWDRGLQAVQEKNHLAKMIQILGVNAKPITEDFSYWKGKEGERKNPDPQHLPILIEKLLPPALVQRINLAPVLDDRMFVVSWYGNKELMEHILGTQPEQGYKTNDWWYQFTFVDRDGASCPNLEMRQEQLTRATYSRWANYNTLYGVSRYSFVALTDHMSVSYEEFAKVICSHTQTIYYKIALLALIQRACILRFSQEVTTISELQSNDRRIGARVSSLFKQYLRFVNKIYFREISAQEQGIELYDMIQNQMRLDKHVKDLEHEIQELHNYVSMLEEEARAGKLDVLTYIGALFVVPSFIASYFGMEGFIMKDQWWHVTLFCALAAFLAVLVVRSQGKMRIFLLILLCILMFTILVTYPNYIYGK